MGNPKCEAVSERFRGKHRGQGEQTHTAMQLHQNPIISSFCSSVTAWPKVRGPGPGGPVVQRLHSYGRTTQCDTSCRRPIPVLLGGLGRDVRLYEWVSGVQGSCHISLGLRPWLDSGGLPRGEGYRKIRLGGGQLDSAVMAVWPAAVGHGNPVLICSARATMSVCF